MDERAAVEVELLLLFSAQQPLMQALIYILIHGGLEAGLEHVATLTEAFSSVQHARTSRAAGWSAQWAANRNGESAPIITKALKVASPSKEERE